MHIDIDRDLAWNIIYSSMAPVRVRVSVATVLLAHPVRDTALQLLYRIPQEEQAYADSPQL